MTIVAFLASRASPSRMAARLDIATSTWKRIRAGVKVPTPGILGRMTSTYRAIQKTRLSRAGFSTKMSKGIMARSPEAVDIAIGKMEELVSIIVSKHDVAKPGNVRAAMRDSDLSWNELNYRVRDGIS